MENLFDKIAALYDEMSKCHAKVCDLKNKYDHLPIPELPNRFYDSKQYEEYCSEMRKFNNDRADIEADFVNQQMLHNEIKHKLISLIPYKAVWFRLPGTDMWIAKTSNNLTAPEGNEIKVHTEKDADLLPKLITC